MSFKKGDKLLLSIRAAGAQGKGIAHTPEGQVVFVPYGVPGDEVEAIVISSKRKYLEARILNLLKPSPARVQPPCTHFGLCGGCKWQHVDYSAQLSYKQEEVTGNLKHIGGLALPQADPIVGCDQVYSYRNKVEFSFSTSVWLTDEQIASGAVFDRLGLGFHMPGRWDKILHIDHCHLHDHYSNSIRNFTYQYARRHQLTFWNPRGQQGLLRTLMIRISFLSQYMVLLQFGHRDSDSIHALLGAISEAFPDITTLLYTVNTKGNDAIYDLQIETFKGPGYIREQMSAYRKGDDPLTFRISPKSFYQTNSRQAVQLYKKILDYIQPQGTENVYDLYTGTGTIALYIARYVRRVTGIELVPDAIADARINARDNHIENADFVAGDMKTAFSDDFIAHYGLPDVVVVDPPRDGMHPAVISQLLRLRPAKIVYVSCNSATQARDLCLMKDSYTVERYGAVDMFPHTHHVESVAMLRYIG